MKRLTDILEQRISAAIRKITGQDLPAMVRLSAEPKFGDYQANGVMAAAKAVKLNPRQMAEQVVAALDIEDICEKPEIAGPGFINLRLKDSFLAARLLEMNTDKERLGIEKTQNSQTVVVDYSGPNIAKEMHVGHLRSTIIGDCIARLCEFEGHTVIRQNHIGDWGTQFGKVILALWHICMARKVHLSKYFENNLEKLKKYQEDVEKLKEICVSIRDRHNEDYKNDYIDDFGDGNKLFGPFLEELKNIIDEVWPDILKAYQFVNLLDDILPTMDLTILTREKTNNKWVPKEILYKNLTRHITVMMQRSHPEIDKQEYDAWSIVREFTMHHCNQIYKRLNVTLEHPRDTRGESFYKDMLADVVETLEQKGLAVKSEGAICIFPDGFKNKDGDPLPFIIQKSDGASLYATTDLAALRFRIQELHADEIIYVTDTRQSLHFQMLFAVAKMAGWTDDKVELMHVTFGTMLGEDGTPFKTRTGGTVKLKDLLEEAVQRAQTVVEEKNPDLPAEQKAAIARAVGIGAVKYADYSNNRNSDYIFSFDKMLAMEGNTAPYMQYAYARIKSIERKAAGKDVDIESQLTGITSLNFTDNAEKDLGKLLIRYDQAIDAAAGECRPNYLTGYLYDLAQAFSRFYNACPVLQADAGQQPLRLLLCDITARTIRHGLSKLLGIDVVEQM
jgi:arginyl-tRNA synthetase